MDNRPKIGVAVIVIKDNKVLLGKRIGTHGKNTWGFPGGHLEFNETIEHCAKRETREEAGINISNLHLGSYANAIFKKEHKHSVTLFVFAN